jgi:hypothetical protein
MLMFLGEMLCLFGYLVVRLKERFFPSPELKRQTRANYPSNDYGGGESDDVKRLLLEKNQSENFDSLKDNTNQGGVFQWVLILPTLCDLTGSTLGKDKMILLLTIDIFFINLLL